MAMIRFLNFFNYAFKNMKKRLLFAIQYALLCAFTMFLMITVYAKHYRFDAGFFVPLISAFTGALLTGWFTANNSWKRFRHTKIGIIALAVTFIFSWIGFWVSRMAQADAVFFVSALKGLADAWLSFVAGAIIMVPAYVLLTYLAEGKKREPVPED